MPEEKEQMPKAEEEMMPKSEEEAKEEVPGWLDALLGGVFIGTLAALAGQFLFDGDYAYQVGIAGAVLMMFISGIKGVVFYAPVFALMQYFFGIVF